MGSTEEGNPLRIGEQRSLFEGEGRDVPTPGRAERDLGANPKVPLQAQPTFSQATENATLHPVSPAPAPEPVWFQRLKLVIFVFFSVELGMALVVLPWTALWNQNNFLISHPDLRTIFQHSFARGAVSGLGLVDVWIGIWAAVKYRDRK